MSLKLCKPFLRWAGGKANLVGRLLDYVPPNLDSGTYWEPFLGAGSMFFSLRPKRAVLSDLNPHLIHCYRAIKNRPSLVYSYLRRFASENTKTHYYKVREEYNRSPFSYKNAARFIYLNKASFNGIFRVNIEGQFNVPYGRRKRLSIPEQVDLLMVSRALRRARLVPATYERVLKSAKRGDFVYLDPPYPPLNGTAYFAHYTKERFGKQDQKLLARVARELRRKGCRVMITNADKKEIRQLYSGWRIKSIKVRRWITCKAKKHRVEEIVITNY
jgi:DNA adenine methylase